MPKFVYFRAQNKKGYGSSIHWYTQVDGSGKSVTETGSHYFQSQDITEMEASKGINWLERKYPPIFPKEGE